MTEPLRVPEAAEVEERDEDRSRIDTAIYIAELTANLAGMARKHGLDALGFILEMAQLEAENATRHVEGRH
jgi:hypothetical protein